GGGEGAGGGARGEPVGHGGGEGAGVEGPAARQGRPQAARRAGGHQRGRAAVGAGDAPHRADAAGGAGVGAREPEARARLVEEDQPRRRHAGDHRPPRGALHRVLFGRVERLFVRVQPTRAIVRCMVATLTRTPWSTPRGSRCSARGASGVASTWAGRAAACGGPIRAARPGSGRGAREPRRRRWATYRCTVARPTPNVSAAAVWVAPASTAR